MADSSEGKMPSRVHRGPGSSVIGVGLFSTLRILDPFLQYAIITRHVIVSPIPRLLGGTLSMYPSFTHADVLDLPPYPLLILGMAVGSTLKNVFWVHFISEQEMPPSHAFPIAGFNTVFNLINTAASIWSLTTPYDPSFSMWQSPSIIIGTILYVIGSLTETISEIQRARFKRDPANAGKPYSGGLFGLARNINYCGFVLWRAGYALAAGGPILALLQAGLQIPELVRHSIPDKEEYCEKRYGDDWTKVKEKVPYKLFPGIY
jgi:protein-S-isoprenylcysteine O-methyltransferase Ste14